MNGDVWVSRATLELVYAYSGQGLTGSARSICDLRSGAFVDSYDIGPTHGANGFDGTQAWMKDMSGAVTPQAGGDTLLLAFNEAYRNANLWWQDDRGGATVVSLGRKLDGPIEEDALEVTPRGGKPFEARFDVTTHFLRTVIEPQGFATVTTSYGDYRPIEGATIAHDITIDDAGGAANLQIETLSKARFLPRADVAAYGPPRPLPSDFTIAGAPASTTTPFRLLNNHIYVEVRVNGKGPFRFILDSGGHDIVTPATAKLLGLKVEGQAESGGAGTARVESGYAKVESLALGRATLRNQTVSVLAFEPAEVEGFPVDGMLGFEWLRRFAVRIDFGAHTLTSSTFAAFVPPAAATAVPFVFYSHLPQVIGAFEGIPGSFNIDTGSRVELTLTRPFVDAHDLRTTHPHGVLAVDGWGVGGRSRSYVTRASELQLGPVTIPGIVASFSTQTGGSFSDANYAGNVGSGLLKRFVVTFDYAHLTMYLEPLPKPVADTAVFDRSGLWINAVRGAFEVVDVSSGGPGDSAGLKAGDRIVAIDGVPAKAIALSDLRVRLRNEPAGTVVTLSVQRGGALKSVPLTLRDQI